MMQFLHVWAILMVSVFGGIFALEILRNIYSKWCNHLWSDWQAHRFDGKFEQSACIKCNKIRYRRVKN